jgi:uncharacterized membrane protein
VVAAIINKKNAQVDDEDPLVILNRRFEQGEISEEEYEEGKNALLK